MVYAIGITLATAALWALPVNAGLYPKNSLVHSLDASSYERLIARSNFTSMVEFYAPWCGHCKNLQPAYEKAAKSLAGLAKIAAVNCDAEENKPFCGRFGVQGFPTLKIVKPSSKPGSPSVEDYNGPRTATGIVDAVIEKMPNLVKRVDNNALEKWIDNTEDTPKAILFTEKGKTSALLKAVAIEFKDKIQVAQMRITADEKGAMELFKIKKLPTLLLLNGGKEGSELRYDGEMNKKALLEFLSEAAEPNPDPAPERVKLSKSKDPKKLSKIKDSGKTASATASGTDEGVMEEAIASPTPVPEAQKPIIVPDPAPQIPILTEKLEADIRCLSLQTGTCILALLPDSPGGAADALIGALSEIAHRQRQAKRPTIPFYILPESNSRYAAVRNALSLDGHDYVIAINGKRGWWRLMPDLDPKSSAAVVEGAIEDWVAAIKIGEGQKRTLPQGLIPAESEERVKEAYEDVKAEESHAQKTAPEEINSADTQAGEVESEKLHDEL